MTSSDLQTQSNYQPTCFSLLKQQGPTCMIYASAMLLGITPAQVVELTGYNGLGRRSHHPQELIDMARRLGKVLLPIERYPKCYTDGIEEDVYNEIDADSRFGGYLRQNKGLLYGFKDGQAHMCAWNGQWVYDPHGYTVQINDPRYKWTMFLLLVD